jgi:hypothetical protein
MSHSTVAADSHPPMTPWGADDPEAQMIWEAQIIRRHCER